MMRFATLSVAGLFLVAVLVMAMWPTDARFGAPDSSFARNSGAQPGAGDAPVLQTDESRPTKLNKKIYEKLQQPASFSFNEIPFQDVLAELRDVYEINALLDSSAKEDELDLDTDIIFDRLDFT